ncbi:hypothetical protein TELCIR_04338 [Teladorsagia circumcincta]|uniref:Uncharacterized protein n=1 Tax=Teladorsagia circumcincta TaxID=45464 RepID=A0A2G9UTW9_TELCI|nr:hypothetical protein TELCIR_04338 [Teladorsagia circumcincta]
MNVDDGNAGKSSGSQAPMKDPPSVYLQVGSDSALEEFDLSSAPSCYYQSVRVPSPDRKGQAQSDIAEAGKAQEVQKCEAEKPVGQGQAETLQVPTELRVPQDGQVAPIPQDGQVATVPQDGQVAPAQETAASTGATCDVVRAQEMTPSSEQNAECATPPQLVSHTAPSPELVAAQEIVTPVASDIEVVTAREISPPVERNVYVATARAIEEPVKRPTEPATSSPPASPFEGAVQVKPARIIPIPIDLISPKRVQKPEAMSPKDQVAVQSPKVERKIEGKEEKTMTQTPPTPGKTPKRILSKRQRLRDLKQAKAETPKLQPAKRILSDPIVTPRTDEYPTDEAETEKAKMAEAQKKPTEKAPASPLVEKPKEEAKAEVKETKPTSVITKLQAQLREIAKVKPAATPESKPQKPAKVEKAGTPQRKAGRRVSDPIVTPVSDEYPTEDLHGDWIAPAVIDTRPKGQRKDNYEKGGDANKENIISNPIITPRTDEYPTPTDEPEKSMQLLPPEPEPRGASKDAGKKPASKKPASKGASKEPIPKAPSKEVRVVSHEAKSKGPASKTKRNHDRTLFNKEAENENEGPRERAGSNYVSELRSKEEVLVSL